MTEDVREKRAEQEREWVAKMEPLGLDIVRARFADRRPVIDQAPYPDPSFVERWLIEETRGRRVRAAWLYAIPLAVAVVGAIAACIAAWPVLFGPR